MKHIAVLGSGISGLAAAWLLSRRHRVLLLERDDRLGGHTHTIDLDTDRGPLALDTGFLVHNPVTYPNLVRLFAEIGVETRPSDMSFSVSSASGDFEYSSRGVSGFFAQGLQAASPGHLRLLADIVRFNRDAPAVLTTPGADHWTLDDYLRQRPYGPGLFARYLAPMASAIWSASIADIREFPVQTLVRFMQNHGMLAIGRHPEWRVVAGGSARYIPKLTAPVASVRTGVRIEAIRRMTNGAGEVEGVEILETGRPPLRVDDVVLACHGDQVLPLIADATGSEREVLGAFSTTANDAWLHTDAGMLPRRPRARASWNYRLHDDATPPTVTYHLNRLQGLSTCTEYCVTLNPRGDLDESKVIRRIPYRHPRMTGDAVRAQARWREVSGVRRTHFCGAYWRYGFHEDGLLSAIRVAADLGVSW